MYVGVYVCVYVCTAMHFIVLRGMELKLGTGVGDGPTRFKIIFSKRPDQRSKIMQRARGHVASEEALTKE